MGSTEKKLAFPPQAETAPVNLDSNWLPAQRFLSGLLETCSLKTCRQGMDPSVPWHQDHLHPEICLVERPSSASEGRGQWRPLVIDSFIPPQLTCPRLIHLWSLIMAVG